VIVAVVVVVVVSSSSSSSSSSSRGGWLSVIVHDPYGFIMTRCESSWSSSS